MDIRKEIEKTTKVIVADLLYINNRKTNFTENAVKPTTLVVGVSTKYSGT